MPESRIIFMSELFYPEESSTGHLLTQLATSMADFDEEQILALCAQPTYSKRGVRAPRREVYKKVNITRVWSTTYAKDRIVGRLLNAITFTISLLLKAVLVAKRGDVMLVVTNPPSLPFIAVLAAKLKEPK